MLPCVADAGITYLIGHPRQHRCLTVAAQRGPKQAIGKFVRLEIARTGLPDR